MFAESQEQELERLCSEFCARFENYLVRDRKEEGNRGLYWTLAQILAALRIMPALRERIQRDPKLAPLMEYLNQRRSKNASD